MHGTGVMIELFYASHHALMLYNKALVKPKKLIKVDGFTQTGRMCAYMCAHAHASA